MAHAHCSYFGGCPSAVLCAHYLPLFSMRQWLYEACIAGLAAAHVGVTLGMDVPGCGRGYLGPAGLAAPPAMRECTGGAAGYALC
jgi:hypothetical protein